MTEDYQSMILTPDQHVRSCYINTFWYRVIVRFLKGLDLLFITLSLHFFLSWMSSLSISSSTISASTFSNHVFHGLPTCLLACCFLHTPLTLASGGSDLPTCCPPASSVITLARSSHKSRGDNVVHMLVQLKI